MIFIAVKFTVLPERADSWLDFVADFTAATRKEAGNLFFEWSRSIDDPNEFVLLEAFADAAAGAVHVGNEHFKTAMSAIPDALAGIPKIINVEVPGQTWSAMAELKPRGHLAAS
jgi:quinol monooxygenase YgiN